MQIYVNGVQRDDVVPLVGGSLEETAAHRTSSDFSVKIPVGANDLNQDDYIIFKDGDTTVFAGIIRGIDQQNMGNSPDLDSKIYKLTIASNVDRLSGMLVDLQFPSGANINQIIFGNHPAQTWYNSSFGEFYGVFETRMAPEGITLGTVDDFTNISLSETAYLWGSYISDVLDSICDAAGAWWELTNDLIFNMRFSFNAIDAPFSIDENAPIYDLESSRDSYTEYSAVRVVGGSGDGGLIEGMMAAYEQADPTNGLIIRSATEAELAYPLSKDIQIFEESTSIPGGGLYPVRIGYTGINDNDTDIDILVSYGSTKIEVKNGFSFLYPLSGQDSIDYQYVPLIPIVCRLVSKELRRSAAEMASSNICSRIIQLQRLPMLRTPE